MSEQDTGTLDYEALIRRSIEVARAARAAGNHPFGALLVDSEGKILMEQGNVFGEQGDATGHAERVLMTRASIAYDAEFLAACTMVTSAEPCAMCAGSVYWAGVGRVVFGMRERALKEFIGPHPENLTLDLPCETIFAAGQRKVQVVGPLLEEEAAEVHIGAWD
ncbi:MAG: nucleoside deaminase [Pseudomonadota bacterium]